jgi:chemotaxis protein histidine kinase CheA
MVMVKQTSAHRRQWTDGLPRLVSVCALCTLLMAVMAGILGQRLDTLALAQREADQAAKTQNEKNISAALGSAKAQWERQRASLEKELLSARLKLKTEQKTRAGIRARLAVLQKELATLKKGGTAQVVQAAAPVESSPQPSVQIVPPAKPAPAQTAAAKLGKTEGAISPPAPVSATTAQAQPAAPAAAAKSVLATAQPAATPAPPAAPTTAVKRAAPVVQSAAEAVPAPAPPAATETPKSSLLEVPDAGEGPTE